MASPVVKNVTQTSLKNLLNLTSPADTAVGDLVICFCWAQGTVTPTYTRLAGFSQVRVQQDSDGTTSGNLIVMCTVATAAGIQTYTPVTVASGTSGQICGGIIVVTGADTYVVSPDAWPQNSTNDITATAPNPPSVTGLTGDFLVLTTAAWHVTTAAAVSATVMANYTLRLNGPTGTHVTHLAAASRAMTGLSAATEDPATWVDNVTPNGSAVMTFAVPAATGADPVDTFNRTDSSAAVSLGANWTPLDRTMNVVTNAASPLELNWCSAYWTGTVLTDNQYSEVVVGTVAGGSGLGPMVRMKADFSYYYLYADGTWIFLQKIVAGAAAVTIRTISQVVGSGDTLRLEVEGSNLYSYHNTVLKDISADTAITTGAPGLFCFPSGALTNATINQWAGGNMVVAAGHPTMRRWGGIPTMLGGQPLGRTW